MGCGIQSPIEFRNYESYWLRSAVERGELIFHEASGLKIQPGEYEGIFGLYEETTSRKELNAWLERIGHLKRIPEPAAPSASTTDSATSESLQDAGRPGAQDSASAGTEAGSAAEKTSTAGAGVVRHSTKTRAKPLAAVFARAKKEATDATCPHSVWAALVALPASASPPPELGEYRKNDNRIKATGARTGWLTKDAFLDRWRRGNV